MPDIDIEVEVKCPFQDCPSKKIIKVPSHVFENKAFGTLKIQIAKGYVCPEHQFVVFLDKKGVVRGTEKIDMQIAVAQKIKPEQELTADLNTIDTSIGDFALCNIFHAFILDTPVVIVKKTLDEAILDQIILIFKNFFPDLFELKNPLKIMNQNEFKDFKMTNILVIDDKGFIINSPWQIDNFEFEKENLIQKTLESKDIKTQIIIFKQLISTLMKKVEVVREMLNSGSGVIYAEDIKTKLEKEFLVKKVSDYDLNLIKEILKSKYLVDVSRITLKTLSKLKSGIW